MANVAVIGIMLNEEMNPRMASLLLKGRRMNREILYGLACWMLAVNHCFGAVPRQASLLRAVKTQMQKEWPSNKTINIVFHGHSVPSGYFKTPEVKTFQSYPYLFHEALTKEYPHAVINVIVTAIGGEDSSSGAARFDEDVLSHHPDVIFVDYGLNDRRIGLKKAKQAWISIIEKTLAKNIVIILMTPTPDMSAELNDPEDALNQHADQICSLADQYDLKLVDSLAAFQEKVKNGVKVDTLMSQINHPNERGHAIVAEEIVKHFVEPSEPTVTKMSLWKDEIPYFKDIPTPEMKDEEGWLRNVDTPEMEIYLPPEAQRNGSAVVICPGGGYSKLSIVNKGYEVARWLNTFGTTGIVLKYRHKPFQHPVPLTDAQRAIRLTRNNCSAWGLDPARIGIMGFSAGGHLASTAGTHFDHGDKHSDDPVDRLSARPDFMILIKPVISMKDGIMHERSRENLIGVDPRPELIELLSNELHVTADTPPTFLVHASDDVAVSPLNSLYFYQALLKAGVPCELHLYQKGGHGFGLYVQEELGPAGWMNRCRKWMWANGF